MCVRVYECVCVGRRAVGVCVRVCECVCGEEDCRCACMFVSVRVCGEEDCRVPRRGALAQLLADMPACLVVSWRLSP